MDENDSKEINIIRPTKRLKSIKNDIDIINNESNKILKQLEYNYPSIRCLLQEFLPLFNISITQSIESDREWFWLVEFKILCLAIYQMTFLEFGVSVTKPDYLTKESYRNNIEINDEYSNKDISNGFDTTINNATVNNNKLLKDKEKKVDHIEMNKRLKFLYELTEYSKMYVKRRLESTIASEKKIPRVFHFAEKCNLNNIETEIVQLLVVFQGSQSNAIRIQVLEDDVQRRMIAIQRLVGSSEIDMEAFYVDTREYVKEGLLLVDEEHFGTTFHLSPICVRVLLGNTLSTNQLLKLSQTVLEKILREEGVVFETFSHDKEDNADNNNNNNDVIDLCFDENEGENDKDIDISDDDDNNENSAFKFIGSHSHIEKSVTNNNKINIDKDERIITNYSTKEDLKPYSPENQLDYLEDCFQVVAFAIRASGARVKDQMKEAGTKQPWENSGAGSTTAGRRELKAKQLLHEKKVQHRLLLTKRNNFTLPRLEQMSKKFQLNRFEQNVIVMLIGRTISPVIKNLIDAIDTSPVQRMDESTTINQILSVFCDTFQEQVAHRILFYKSSRLLSKGLIKLHRGRWHSTAGDLVDQRVELDRRVLDWVVGLDTEINELVEGSDLYNPKVGLDKLILPEEYKENIIQTVKSYEEFKKYRLKIGLNETVAYGTGLILLLCGASGTGKTMTVNAVANYLKKRVLLVDFPSLRGGRKNDSNNECDADLRGLFREAEMSNAILFFDECESIFKQRDFGGDRLLNALLTEMEKYDGIVFLATNRPYDLDEAMHRRITAVYEFKPPDHIQRKKIWKVLLSDKIQTDSNIDWDMISLKYELSGGFIKNAILSALLKAISRNSKNPIITEKDIIHGCSLQMRGSLQMKTFDHRVVPTAGLDKLILDIKIKEKLTTVVNFEKARHVIYGQWGFDFNDDKSKQKGISVLLTGPKGIGKIAAAKCIGFEIGKPLKLVNFLQTQMSSMIETRKALKTVFDDARLMDAVLVLDGFEMFGSIQMDGNSGEIEADTNRFRMEASRLMDMIDSFPGICILIANVDKSTMGGYTLHDEFSRRIKFIIEMKSPEAQLRTLIWISMFPENAPMDKDKIDFKKLGERFELTNEGISNAVFRAAANVALREEDKRMITMKDLMEAAEIERKKSRGSHADVMDSLFT